jgi:deoxyribose-phosphate aldolase
MTPAWTPARLARLIDHTLLKPEASPKDVEKLCREALEHSFLTVCINSASLPVAVPLLRGSQVLPITVVGFPLGACLSTAKAGECYKAIEAGAREIDMVMNAGWAKAGLWIEVERDIVSVLRACDSVPVKVILETSLLSDQEIVKACTVCKNAGAAFVKTSTGFGSAGATVDHIRLMRQTVGAEMGVKASGGVRTLEAALKMIEAGANRIGSSASVKMIEDLGRST